MTQIHEPRIATGEVRDDIGILTINNPPRNSLVEPDFADIGMLREWMNREAVKGIIITGAGRHFSDGAQLEKLKLMAREELQLMNRMTKGKELLDYLDTIEVPVIAAISGACFGGGLEIALACHIRVCGQNALLAFPETTHNLMPGLGGTIRLPRLIGTGRSIEMIMSGDIINADRAKEIGLAEHVVPRREVFDYSISLMKKMVDGKPMRVIRSVVRALNNARTLDARAAMEEETKMFCRLAAAMHE